MAVTAIKRPIRGSKDTKDAIPPPEAPITPPSPSPNPFEVEDDEDEELNGVSVGKQMHEAQKAKLAARKLPPIAPRTTFEDFITYWRQLSEEQKSHIIIYWYRIAPKIDRQLVNRDNPKYIECAVTDEQMNLEYMRNTHGGGKYQGIVNDTDLRTNAKLTEILLEIPIAQFDPVIDLEELDMVDRTNQPFINKLKAQGKITSDGRVVKNPTAEKNREDNMSSMITNKLLDAVLAKPAQTSPSNDNSLTALTNFMMEKMKQENPTTQLAAVMGMMAQIMPKPASDNSLQIVQLLEQQRQVYDVRIAELNNRLMEILSKPVPVPEKPDIAQEIGKVRELIEVTGLGGGGGKTTWVDRLIDTVGPAIPGIVNIISSRMAGSQGNQGNPGVPRLPNDLTDAGRPAPGLPEGTTPQGGEMAFLDMVIANAGGEFISAISNGVDGITAAESVVNLKGRPMYNMIVKDGKQALVDAMTRNADFALTISRITTPERLDAWLEDFIHAFDEDLGDDTEDIPPAPPVKKKAN